MASLRTSEPDDQEEQLPEEEVATAVQFIDPSWSWLREVAVASKVNTMHLSFSLYLPNISICLSISLSFYLAILEDNYE